MKTNTGWLHPGKANAVRTTGALPKYRNVYLIDLDGTVLATNTMEFLPGAKEKLEAIGADADNAVFFFSIRDPAGMLPWLQYQFPFTEGYIRKPWADRYVVIDDKFDLQRSSNAL